MVIRAVFFDLGYTLFDETRLWREWAEWLGVSEERLFTELRHVIEQGQDHREAFQLLRPGFDLEAEQMARIRAGRPHRLRASDVYADARPCLANVKARGRLVGVAGNFPSDVIDEALLEPGHSVALSPSRSASPGNVVPWAAILAANVAPTFTIPGVVPCRAVDLAVDVHAVPSYIGGGPRNTSMWTIMVNDKAAMPCFVGSTVDITFATASGPLALSALRTGGDIIYLAPVSTPSSSRYSYQAVGEIDTFPCVVPPVTQMSISPAPGLGTVLVNPWPPGGFGAPCPSTKRSYLAELYPENCCSGYAPSTQTSMDVPAVAHPGEHLRFLVTMTNRPLPHSEIRGTKEPTPTPMAFAHCLTYHEELEGIAGTFHTYQLNCAAAAPIPANASETFEMFVDVPAEAHPGPSVLVWSIDGTPTVHARRDDVAGDIYFLVVQR